MFNKKLIAKTTKLEEQKWALEADKTRLGIQIEELKLSLFRLESKKKIEEEDIKHMIRLKEERWEVEKERFKMEIRAARDSEIAEVKDQYRDKLEGRLEKEVLNMKSMYSQVLARLPNVNLKGTLNGNP